MRKSTHGKSSKNFLHISNFEMDIYIWFFFFSDPQIQTLVPLKNVITEICKHQLTYKLPVIQSFQQFFSLIEEDNFQKLQFTNNGKQFYQEKFISDLNSQAVVFGNRSVIEQLSDSQLMYVDASFGIDTNEDFKYHLITILVWVDDSVSIRRSSVELL